MQPATTLIFPAIGQSADDYALSASQRGEPVVCASSVPTHELSVDGVKLHLLPSIYDSDFAIRLAALIEEHNIGRVFCPVAAVYDFLRRFLATSHPNVKLLGSSPIEHQMRLHRALIERARRFESFIAQIHASANRLSVLEIAGILRQASLIYGESNDEKLAAMMAIFASAPKGDVIEIGSLMGRSAFVLLYLAWRYRVGPILTVDPWRADEAVQHKSPKQFQELVDVWDFEVIAEGFMINLIPFRRDDHAHLRMTSEKGILRYVSDDGIESQLGSRIAYKRRIAVIHIDGNHDYDAVQKDCALWLEHLAPGAWVILDDYVWSHGDGPQRVGNELLQSLNDQIERSFVCGKALFIKFQ